MFMLRKVGLSWRRIYLHFHFFVVRSFPLTQNALRATTSLASLRCSVFSVVDCAGRSKFRWMADTGTIWKLHGETVVNNSHFGHGITLQIKRPSRFVSSPFFCGRLVEIYRVVGRKILIEDDVSLHGRLDWGKTTKMASRFHISRRVNRDAESEACHFSKLCWVDS